MILSSDGVLSIPAINGFLNSKGNQLMLVVVIMIEGMFLNMILLNSI